MNKVYVLGAGASYAFNKNAPQMKDLLRESLTFSEIDITLDAEKAKMALHDFIKDFYGYLPVVGESDDDPNVQLPPFEDMLSQVDYCIANNLPLSNNYDVEKLRHVRIVMLYALGRVIQKSLEMDTDEGLVDNFLRKIVEERLYCTPEIGHEKRIA